MNLTISQVTRCLSSSTSSRLRVLGALSQQPQHQQRQRWALSPSFSSLLVSSATPLNSLFFSNSPLLHLRTNGFQVGGEIFSTRVEQQRRRGCRVQALSGEAGAAAAMVKTFKVHEVGGPEVLSWEDVEVGEPGEGQVRVRHTAVGLNFIDVYFRKGQYKCPLPFIPGMEAAGVVTAVGPGLTGRKIGDRVVYAGVPGAYCEERLISAEKVVPLPSSVDDVTGAAIFLKGMTAQFLLRRAFKVEPGHTVLVHAAAGGVGSLLVQWAHGLGAIVIGAVSTEDKAAQAKADGADHVLIYSKEDIATRVKEITKGVGVQVVYDSVGKDTFQASMDALAVRGYFLLFGQSSGLVDPIPVPALATKSIFLSRPSMMAYTGTRHELLETAGEVFAALSGGILKIRVNQTYPLAQVGQAHSDLEARKTTGSTVLVTDTAEKAAVKA